MKLTFTILLLFQYFNLISEVQKDTSSHNYLIAAPKVTFRRTHIYKEGSRFMIMDSLHQKHWGNLHIINDSTISLVSGKTEENDTFILNNIYMLKRKSVSRFLFNTLILVPASAVFVVGVTYIIYGINFKNRNPNYRGLMNGNYIITAGMILDMFSSPFILYSSLKIDGRKHSSRAYILKVLMNKKADLKRKEV